MKQLFRPQNRSAGYAKSRMKLLLVSERIESSPHMINMIKHDLIHTIRKYLLIDEQRVTVKIKQEPPVLYAEIPVLKKKDRRNAKTI